MERFFCILKFFQVYKSGIGRDYSILKNGSDSILIDSIAINGSGVMDIGQDESLIPLFPFLRGEQEIDFFDLSFEVVSAVCTVGLSRGLTGELGDFSKFLLTFMMFAGRLGPLTLAYFIATPIKSQLRYPTTHIPIG